MDIKTVRVDNVDGIDTNSLSLENYTKNLFLGAVSDALYDAEYD